MSNKGNYVASLGQVCRYLAKKAEEKGVEIYTGFAVSEILYDNEGKVRGAKTIDTGVDHHGKPLENYQEGTQIEAKLTIFAEGVRGSLAKQLIEKFDLQKDKNPQIFSLGCKELWSVPEGKIKPGEVYHTLGWPLNMHEFGGGFIYGLKDNKLALGLVVGLDYQDPTFDVHSAFQIWKTNPFIAKLLEGGKLMEYGAKTLPEGGYYSLPKLYTDHGYCFRSTISSHFKARRFTTLLIIYDTYFRIFGYIRRCIVKTPQKGIYFNSFCQIIN